MLPATDQITGELTRKVRRILAERFSEETLCRWFDPLRLEWAGDARQLSIVWPHGLFAGWVDKEYREALEAAARQAGNRVVVFRSAAPKAMIDRPVPNPARKHTPKADLPFGTSFTLENFFYNAKNEFPLSVLRESAVGIVRCNPLVLCGETSTGKTHLARALGNALAGHLREETLFCGSADDLALLLAPLSGRDLLKKLRALQAVIVDDIQRVTAFPHLVEILPMMLDHCVEQAKIFMATCTLDPLHWEQFPKALRTRLEQGLIMQLHEADMDIRLRYAQQLARSKRLALSRDQVLVLAQQCPSLRKLSGALQWLTALRDLLNHDVTAKDIESVLVYTADTRMLTPQEITGVVAGRYNVRPEDIFGNKRQPRVARARQVAMFLCRSLLGSSYPALGRIFGGQDHSTVIHSVKKIQELWDNDKDMHNQLQELSLLCRQEVK